MRVCVRVTTSGNSLAFGGRDARAALLGHRHVREFRRDHLVVRAGVRERLAREFEAQGLRHGAPPASASSTRG